MIGDYKDEFSKKLTASMQEHLEKLTKNESQIAARHTLTVRESRPSKSYFEFLWRRKSARDLDYDQKKILLRIHLKQKPAEQISREQEARAKQKLAEEEELKKEDPKGKGRGKDDKKDSKRAKPAGRRRKEEEKPDESAEKKTDNIHLIDEKCLEEALTMIKYCLELTAKLVMVVVSYGDAFGIPKKELSTRFFYDWLTSKLDQNLVTSSDNIRFEKDADDNFPFDSAADNSVLVFENIFFYPEETGYRFDEQTQVLEKTDPDKVEEVISLLSEYCNYYIIDDKYNFFKNFNTITEVKSQLNVLGFSMYGDLQMLAQTMMHSIFRPDPFKGKRPKQRLLLQKQYPPQEPKSSIALIGSDLTGDHIIALDTLAEYYDIFYFMGVAGVLVYMYYAKIEQIGSIVLDSERRALLGKVLEGIEKLGKPIRFPLKFELGDVRDLELPEEERMTRFLSGRVCYPLRAKDPRQTVEKTAEEEAEEAEEAKKEEEKKVKADLKKKPAAKQADKGGKDKKGKNVEKVEEEQTPAGLNSKWEVAETTPVREFAKDFENCRNILWIGSLGTMKHPELNVANKYYANILYEKHQKRSQMIQNSIPVDDFVSTIIGADLPGLLEYFQFDAELAKLEKKKKKKKKTAENNEDSQYIPTEEEQEAQEEEQQDEDGASEEEEEGEEEPEFDDNGNPIIKPKITNLDLISSVQNDIKYYSGNEEFLIKLLGGSFIKGNSFPHFLASSDVLFALIPIHHTNLSTSNGQYRWLAEKDGF